MGVPFFCGFDGVRSGDADAEIPVRGRLTTACVALVTDVRALARPDAMREAGRDVRGRRAVAMSFERDASFVPWLPCAWDVPAVMRWDFVVGMAIPWA
jgi:hypothetical protein